MGKTILSYLAIIAYIIVSILWLSGGYDRREYDAKPKQVSCPKEDRTGDSKEDMARKPAIEDGDWTEEGYRLYRSTGEENMK